MSNRWRRGWGIDLTALATLAAEAAARLLPLKGRPPSARICVPVLEAKVASATAAEPPLQRRIETIRGRDPPEPAVGAT